MKLSKYVSQLCAGLEANPTDENGNPGVIRLTFNAEDAVYRRTIANTLRDIFCGASSGATDMLFYEGQQLTNAYENALKKQASLECFLSKSSTDEKAQEEKKEPKCEIEKAPKRVRIPKAKIEKAVKKTLAPKQEFPVED